MNIELNIETVITIAISVFTVFVSIILVLATWLKQTLIRLFTSTVNGMRESVDSCQTKINKRLDKLDDYVKDTRDEVQESKNLIHNHVERHHTK